MEFKLCKEVVDQMNLSRIPMKPGEEEDIYNDRMYGDAQNIFIQVIELVSSQHPELVEEYADVADYGEEWYDSITDEIIEYIMTKISVLPKEE